MSALTSAQLETDSKKLHWPKNILLSKNPQFSSDFTEILATLPTDRLIILTKFHDDWTKIVDILEEAFFGVSVMFFESVYM